MVRDNADLKIPIPPRPAPHEIMIKAGCFANGTIELIPTYVFGSIRVQGEAYILRDGDTLTLRIPLVVKDPAPQPNRHPLRPPIAGILQFFSYAHLPPHLAMVSKPFCDLAHALAMGDNCPEAGNVTMGDVAPIAANPELTVALRKLLEAKDAAVRAVLFKG